MGKRGQSRRAAAATPAPTASAWRTLAPRFRRANLIGFVAAAPFALLAARPAPQLVALAALAALVLGAGLWARRRGLPESSLTAPLTALAFALVAAGRALAGGDGYAGTLLAGLLVFLQTALAMSDTVAAPSLAPPAPGLARLGAALARGPGGRLAVTAALALIVVRGPMVALGTHQGGAWAWAAIAALAAALLWLRPTPRGTLLARLVFATIPGGLVLGIVTDFGLWAPLGRPIAGCLGAVPPGPLPLLAAVAAASAVALLTTLMAAGAAAAQDAAGEPAEASQGR
ncbi:MAG TPA: hypothetical protein VGQ83_06925 [Polyangia bacterium]